MGCKEKKVYTTQSEAQQKANKLNNDLERDDYRRVCVYRCEWRKNFHLSSKSKWEYRISAHEKRMKNDAKYRNKQLKKMLLDLNLRKHAKDLKQSNNLFVIQICTKKNT